MSYSDNLPPGVSPSDPHLTGIYPPEQVMDSCVSDLMCAMEYIESAQSFADDQGALKDKDYKEFEAAENAVQACIDTCNSKIRYDDGEGL